mgnify:FL=1
MMRRYVSHCFGFCTMDLSDRVVINHFYSKRSFSVIFILFTVFLFLGTGCQPDTQKTLANLQTNAKVRLLVLGPLDHSEFSYRISNLELKKYLLESMIPSVTDRFYIIPEEEVRQKYQKSEFAALFNYPAGDFTDYQKLSTDRFQLARNFGRAVDADFVAVFARDGTYQNMFVGLIDVSTEDKFMLAKKKRNKDTFLKFTVIFNKQVVKAEPRLIKVLLARNELNDAPAPTTIAADSPEAVAIETNPQTARENKSVSQSSTTSGAKPAIFVRSPDNRYVTDKATIYLDTVVVSTSNIESVEVYINGVRALDGQGRGLSVEPQETVQDIQITKNIPVQIGSNKITLIARTSEGVVSEKEIEFTREKSYGNIYAVVIGINNYQKVPPLRYAVGDAQAFTAFLTDHLKVPADQVIQLTDDAVTLSSMRSVMGGKLRKMAAKEDTVIIFYAGHGSVESDDMNLDGDGLEKYLLPHDADPDELFGTALSMTDLNAIFNRIKSDRLIFIADACYSGAVGGRTIFSPRRATISDNFLDRLSSGSGRVIIAASGANQVAKEDPELGHGVFTYHLIEGLKGAADSDGDGYVTVDEAYSHVSSAVQRATGQEQTPVRKGEITGEIYLGKSAE